MTARVRTTLKGRTPMRAIVMLTGVPTGPRRRSTTSLRSMPSVSLPSILRMTSPGLSPAFVAGNFGADAGELALAFVDQVLVLAFVQEVGMRIERRQHALERVRDQLVLGHRLDVARAHAIEHVGVERHVGIVRWRGGLRGIGGAIVLRGVGIVAARGKPEREDGGDRRPDETAESRFSVHGFTQ